tara:strand:- start:636 stop:1754 length:1119 start_codon:yes stop_codon:yes gene_type:complete
MKPETKYKCHSCNKTLNSHVLEPNLKLVTSDCKPSISSLRIVKCEHCNLVQKKVDETFLREVNSIYQDYELYSQASGEDQKVFDGSTNKSRSLIIYEWMSKFINKKNGKILEIGCGNGNFLRLFEEFNLGWKLTGTEFNEANREIIEEIPRSSFYSGDIELLNERFDIVAMIHVLEHITEPRKFLESIKRVLNIDGYLFIEVPNLIKSKFDILISDHCSHFTLESLQTLLEQSGFQIIESSDSVVGKELSIIAKLNKNKMNLNSKNKFDFDLAHRLNWLSSFQEILQGNRTRLVIFGSSISATWAAMELNLNFDFFVDEDENRIGKIHVGKEINSLNSLQKGDNIILPFDRKVGLNIINRLGKGYNYILPEN